MGSCRDGRNWSSSTCFPARHDAPNLVVPLEFSGRQPCRIRTREAGKFPYTLLKMTLAGSQLRADQTRYKIVSGSIKAVNPAAGELRGQLELVPGVSLAAGYSKLMIEGEFKLEVTLLSGVNREDGTKRYKFVAKANPNVLEAIDMMITADKHPTVLEKMMR
jgi:hypothetical protein